MNLVFLAENYRSQEAIVQFCYNTFYNIQEGFSYARTKEIPHPSYPPLSFFFVQGEAEEINSDNQLDNALQYVNVHEAQEIVRKVKFLQENWPREWGLLQNGKPDLQQIGVVTFYHDQVSTFKHYYFFFHLCCSTMFMFVSSFFSRVKTQCRSRVSKTGYTEHREFDLSG